MTFKTILGTCLALCATILGVSHAETSSKNPGTFGMKREVFANLPAVKDVQVLRSISPYLLCQKFDPGIVGEFSDTYPAKIAFHGSDVELSGRQGSLPFRFQQEARGLMDPNFIERAKEISPKLGEFFANTPDSKIELKVDLENRIILVNAQINVRGSTDSGVIHECIEAQTN